MVKTVKGIKVKPFQKEVRSCQEFLLNTFVMQCVFLGTDVFDSMYLFLLHREILGVQGNRGEGESRTAKTGDPNRTEMDG